MHDDVGGRGPAIDPYLAGIEPGVQVSAVGGKGEQGELTGVVRQMAKRVPLVHGKIGRSLFEGRRLRPLTRHPQLDRPHQDCRPGVDRVAGYPGSADFLERLLDGRAVVAERLEGQLDVCVGLLVQPADPVERDLAVPRRARDREHRAHVAFFVVAHAGDLDPHWRRLRLRSPSRDEKQGQHARGGPERAGVHALAPVTLQAF